MAKSDILAASCGCANIQSRAFAGYESHQITKTKQEFNEKDILTTSKHIIHCWGRVKAPHPLFWNQVLGRFQINSPSLGLIFIFRKIL